MRFISAHFVQIGVPPENIKMRKVFWPKKLEKRWSKGNIGHDMGAQ